MSLQNPNSTARKAGGVEYILIALVMGLMGLFFWAIRGTGGFGGSTGGIFAGLGWGLLWLIFCNRPGLRGPLSSPWIVAAITLGIAFGGMTGYGIYISWLRGQFYLDYPNMMRPIAPWTGFGMLFVCGLQWGGVTGALMAWCHPNCAIKPWQWSARILAGLMGAWLMLYIVRTWPQLFLPFHSEGIYADADHKTCQRAIRTIEELAPHLGLYFGFMSFESFRGRWVGTQIMLAMGLGFALPFTIGAYWQTFQGSPIKLDWWKYWEMSIGLGSGLAFGLVFYLFNRSKPTSAVTHSPIVGYRSGAYLLGVGFPIWIGIARLVFSGYDGFLALHGLETFARTNRSVMQFSVVVPLTIGYVWWIMRLHYQRRQPLVIGMWCLSLAIVAIVLHRLPVGPQLNGEWYALALVLVPAIYLWLGHWILGSNHVLEKSPISTSASLAILAPMCLIGLIVSIPLPMRLGNYLLVGSYLFCISMSVACAVLLFRRLIGDKQ